MRAWRVLDEPECSSIATHDRCNEFTSGKIMDPVEYFVEWPCGRRMILELDSKLDAARMIRSLHDLIGTNSDLMEHAIKGADGQAVEYHEVVFFTDDFTLAA